MSLNWPIPTTATPTYFQVIACPTTTSFQVAITYSDGSWSSGAVTYAWNGTFFVTAVPSTTSFQYQQYGPNASTNSTAGTVTPVGQIAPGLHQCQVIFQTRAGQLTRPSPPVKFTANGGEYVSVTNLPIGPGNVIARILAFTGASGSSFFYIPATPQANGQIVGTSTEVNDNTTLAVVLDFSDPTLFGAAAINIPGNNLPAQIILDGALGFGLYGSRLITWGQRNRIQNFLAMGFEGGQFYNATGGGASSFPCGWTAGAGGAGGSLVGGHWGLGWQASGAGSIYQSAFEDAYGVPILTPNTTYTLRAWIRGNGTSLTATLASATSGFSATATVNGSVTGVGSFQEHAFSTVMPSPIPADMLLTLTWTGTPLIDELSIIYQANPYTDTVMYCSYGDNPEAFDGLTGKLGSTQDQHKVMEMSEIRRAGYFLTQDPGGRLHEFVDNGVTEPAGWTVDEVAANCGLLSAWGLSKSQADDSSASGGEEWFAWMSSVGARIFGGGEPQEISREIYPDWIGATAAQASQWSNATGINPAFQKFCWCLNDPVSRTILFGLTLNGNPQGSANRVYTLNYVGLNTASEIANTGPVRIGFSGKRIATDHARKWTKWNGAVTLNGAALMYRGAGKTQPIFFGGNGTVPGTIPGTGNVYLLNPSRYTDDDYGQMAPYYIAGPIPGEETEQSTGLAGFRKLLAYVTTFIYSPVVCSLSIVPYVDNLANAWKLTVTRPLQTNPSRDLEFGGCSAQGNRIFLKFAALPSSGTDCGISIQRLTAWVRKQKHFPVAGA